MWFTQFFACFAELKLRILKLDIFITSSCKEKLVISVEMKQGLALFFFAGGLALN